MDIIELKHSHLEEACELFVNSYGRQWDLVPILDKGNARKEEVIHMLEWCIEKNPAIAIYENGKMKGYITGFYIERFLGVSKGVFCPEWAHASAYDNTFEVYRLMYQRIAQKWTEDGCLTHAINLLDYAREAQDAFNWNGFGLACIDAVRYVEPIRTEVPNGFCIIKAMEKDMPILLQLVDEQYRHLAKSPIFKPYLEPIRMEELSIIFRQSGNFAWIAYEGNEAIGYMKLAPNEEGAAWVVNGENKFAINGAYVKPEYRGRGIAKLLLSRIIEWAVTEKYEKCSVDFETTNIEASRFWCKHFQPVSRSMVRKLDKRVLSS